MLILKKDLKLKKRKRSNRCQKTKNWNKLKTITLNKTIKHRVCKSNQHQQNFIKRVHQQDR